jgi:hypothetical protein
VTAGVGLVVRADGSGCRLVEYDGSGTVVGQGQRIKLSENRSMAPTYTPATAASDQVSEPTRKAAIWSSPLVQSAGITLADALVGVRADAATLADLPAAQQATDDDPQARFVRLAEELGSYRLAAQQHPEVWAAYRDAADLNGGAR